MDRAALSTDVLWGFATVADKQRVEAFIRRGVRLGLYGFCQTSTAILFM